MKKIGTTRKKVDAQTKANNLASQLQAVYNAQHQAAMNQAMQQSAQALGAQAVDPNTILTVGGTSGGSIPNGYGQMYAGGGGAGNNQLNQQWTPSYQQQVGTFPGYNPLDFITEQQKDELAGMLLKRVLKAISADDKEMLRKLLEGKL